MVRLATVKDAEQLYILNKKFNGKSGTTIPNIQDSLLNNRYEIVVVDEENGALTGFVCVQIRKSFCYEEYLAEITEVFVDTDYRRQGISQNMISFAETYCRKNYSVCDFELLTGKENDHAQALYHKLGYREDGELHLSKSR